MEWNYNNLFNLFSRGNNNKLLLNGIWGLEKESLRVTQDGNLALTPHPEIFEDKTTNKEITTDFSESQIEMITPPTDTIEKTYQTLINTNKYVVENLNNELLWPLSMPGKLPKDNEIPIANFNNSKKGIEKEIYRRGLALRYGKKMQMVSGIHYNFSFHDSLWEYLYNNFQDNETLTSFKNKSYFVIARNVLRYRWLLLYLFGASPVIDNSYEEVMRKKLCLIGECGQLNKYSSYTKFITSLRESIFGYSNSFNTNNKVSFDDLEKYINDLRTLLSTESKKFKRLGLFKSNKQLQLNYNILQKENEYYSPIRFKQKQEDDESLLDALEKKGIEYLELRTFDLNPFNENGIAIEDLYFTHLFFIYCLFNKNDFITTEESQYIDLNHHITSIFGRNEDIELFKNKNQKIKLKEWAKKILNEIFDIARLLDKTTSENKFEESVIIQLKKLENPELLPAAKILSEMKNNNETFIEFGIRHAKNILIKRKKVMHFNTQGYESLELSTQIIIKEALDRNIEVDVMDWKDNFLRLKKGNKTEYIKQATRTSIDSYISPLIMENKNVTKLILAENNIRVPLGKTFNDKKLASNSWDTFSNKNIVVKPNSTNFGKGITILKSDQSNDNFIKAVNHAFDYDNTVIIEEFVEGKEYRFLIIGNEVAAVLHRIPANIIGDGKHTIKELVDIKNSDPLRGIGYKTPLEKIELGAVEINFLRIQDKTPQSIPKKDEQVFLRKNSNISTGGDSIDYTDDVINEYKEIALNAAKAVGAKICGADIIIKDIIAKPDNNNYSIIELNFNPALHIHNYPYKGTNRETGKKVLDLLEF